MAPAYRQQVQATARELVAHRTRSFQAQQQTQQGGQPRDSQGRFAPADAGAAAYANQGGQQAAQQQGASGTSQGTGDVRAQQGQSAPPTAAVAPAAVVDYLAKLKQFAKGLGDDALAAPLVESVQELAQSFQQQLGQRDQQIQQLLASQTAGQYTAQRQFEAEAEKAYDVLSKDVPELKPAADASPADKQAAQQLWLTVDNAARQFFEASWRNGQPISWEQSLVQMGRALLNPNIQANAQRALAQTRTETLAGAPARGTGVTQPQRQMSRDDKDRAAFDALNAGGDPDQIRRELGS